MTLLPNEKVWPQGVTVVTQNLLSPKKMGGSFRGQGALPLINPAGALYGAGSSLVWTPGAAAAPTDAMFSYRGEYHLIDRLSLHGHAFGGTGTALYGFFLFSDGSGIGPAKLLVPEIRITDCDVGWRNGLLPTSNNGDQALFHKLIIERCGIAWRNVASQSMDWQIQQYTGVDCPIHFQFDAGGQFELFSGTTNGGILFRCSDDVVPEYIPEGQISPQPVPENWRPNHAGTYWFNNLRDTSTDGSFMLVDIDHNGVGSWIHMAFRNITIDNKNYYSQGKLLMRPKGPMNISLRNVTYLQQESILGLRREVSPYYIPTLTIKDCLTWGCTSLSDIFASGSEHVLIDGGGNRKGEDYTAIS